MRKVIIATDHNTGHQAIYIDGELRCSDSSVYASEIESYLEANEPVTIENFEADLGDHDCFPDSLENLAEFDE